MFISTRTQRVNFNEDPEIIFVRLVGVNYLMIALVQVVYNIKVQTREGFFFGHQQNKQADQDATLFQILTQKTYTLLLST